MAVAGLACRTGNLQCPALAHQKSVLWKCPASRRFPLGRGGLPASLKNRTRWTRSSLEVEAGRGSGRHGARAQELPADSLPMTADAEKNASMKFRRSVYEREDWIRHRSSTRHLRHILSLTSSRVIRALAPPVLSFTLIAVIVAIINEAVMSDVLPSWVPLLHVASLPFQLIAPALALLLVFRTNASYARFDEARKAWGSNVNRCRDFSRQALAWIRSPSDQEKLQSLLRYCIAFPYCEKNQMNREGALKQELTGVLRQNELELLLKFSHRPNYILQAMSEIIHSCKLSDMERALLDRNITQFHDNLGTCERIMKTPIPLSYTRLTSRFLTIWHAALPFALWDQCGWATIPATFCSAGALFCIEEVGVVIEEPLSILALESICKTIHQNVEGLIEAHADSLIWNKPMNREDGSVRKVNGVVIYGEEASQSIQVCDPFSGHHDLHPGEEE